MSKTDNLNLRDVEILSNSQPKSSSSGSGSSGSGGGYGSSWNNYGSSSGSNSTSGSYGSGGGFGFTPEECMSQEMYNTLLNNGATVSGVYVCGMGWTIPEVTITGSHTGGSSYWPDDFGSFWPMGSFGSLGSPWLFGSSFGSRHNSGGGGVLPDPSKPVDQVKVELPTKLTPLIKENGNLNREQMDRLVKEFDKMLEDCGYAAIQEYLTSENYRFPKVMMDKDLGGPIGTGPKSNNLFIKDIKAISSESLSHEMIHLFQNHLGLYDAEKRLVLEFERALVMDILYYARYAVNKEIPTGISDNTSHYLISNGTSSGKIDTKYREKLGEITKDGVPDSVSSSDLEWIFDIFKTYGPYSDEEKDNNNNKTYSYAALKKSLEIVGAKCKKENKK